VAEVAAATSLLYRGGYLLHEAREAVEPRDAELAGVLAGWRSERIGGWVARFDETWPHARAAAGDGVEVLLLGHAIDLDQPAAGGDEVARALAEARARSAEAFFAALDGLAGAHLILVRASGRHELVQDATGMEVAAYDTRGAPLVASHDALIAELRGYAVSDFARWWLAHPLVKAGGVYYPGISTRYEEIRILTPNTALDLDERRVRRFWPREPLPAVERDELVERGTADLRAQWPWLLERHRMTVSITAGVDSRLTLASTYGHAARLHFHTYWGYHVRSLVEDRRIATELAGRLGLDHAVFSLIGVPPDPELARVWPRMLAPLPGTTVVDALRRNLPPHDLHVRSNLLELVRAYHGRNHVNRRDEFTPLKLAGLMRTAIANELAPHFAEFCAVAEFTPERKLNVHYTDLFHWEHRMGAWHSLGVRAQKVLHRTHVIFNCRRFLALMLGRPLEERIAADNVWALVRALWPATLEVPVLSHAAPRDGAATRSGTT
jgi:hypothetical protein